MTIKDLGDALTVLPCRTFLLIVLRGRTALGPFLNGSEHDSDSNVKQIVYCLYKKTTLALAAFYSKFFHLRSFASQCSALKDLLPLQEGK